MPRCYQSPASADADHAPCTQLSLTHFRTCSCRVDGLVEVVNGFIKQLAAQPSLKTINVALHLGVLHIVLCALGCFYC
jgi:hypothetical protein